MSDARGRQALGRAASGQTTSPTAAAGPEKERRKSKQGGDGAQSDAPLPARWGRWKRQSHIAQTEGRREGKRTERKPADKETAGSAIEHRHTRARTYVSDFNLVCTLKGT